MAIPTVIDASVALRIADRDDFARVAQSRRLVAPRLFWTECCNVLHRSLSRRGAVDGPELIMHGRILAADIEQIDDFDRRAPWDIATLVGWRKTYDAEYLAVARQVGGELWTLDNQLIRGAQRMGISIVLAS